MPRPKQLKLTTLTQREAFHEVHDRVRQCFVRHKFTTFGDALSWWHDIPYETQQLEIGEVEISQFSTDILWLISIFGPKESVDYQAFKNQRITALKPVAVHNPEDIEKPVSSKSSRPKRKTSRRKRF